MKKNLIPIILFLIIGFLLSKFILGQYDNKQEIKPVFNKSETLYFLQYGAYSTKDSMKRNTSELPYYIFSEDDLYYVYIGITFKMENAIKLKGVFEEKGYNIYIKEINCSNKQLIKVLSSYDELISKTNDKEALALICRQILETYERTIGNEH